MRSWHDFNRLCGGHIVAGHIHDELLAAVAAGDFTYADGENGAVATMTSILGHMATYSGRIISGTKR